MRRFNHLILRRQKAFAEAVLRGETRSQMLRDSEWLKAADQFGYPGSTVPTEKSREDAFSHDFWAMHGFLIKAHEASPLFERSSGSTPFRLFDLGDNQEDGEVRSLLIQKLNSKPEPKRVDAVLRHHIEDLSFQIHAAEEALREAQIEFQEAEIVPIDLALAFIHMGTIESALTVLERGCATVELAPANQALKELKSAMQKGDPSGIDSGGNGDPIAIPATDWHIPRDCDRLELQLEDVLQNRVRSISGRKQYEQVHVKRLAIPGLKRCATADAKQRAEEAARRFGKSLQEGQQVKKSDFFDIMRPHLIGLFGDQKEEVWDSFKTDFGPACVKGPPKKGYVKPIWVDGQ